MILTLDQLHRVAPRAPAPWPEALTKTAAEWHIDTPLRVAAFIAQLAHESAEFTRLQENLFYSAEGLMRVWPKRFDLTLANAYARQPEKIANYVYAGRIGNGDEASGDGWRFRGRGPIQVTGRANYRAAGKALGLDLEVEPERILEPLTGARTAGWFWDKHGLNALADKGDLKGITQRINGGLVGYEQRAAYYARAREAFGA